MKRLTTHRQTIFALLILLAGLILRLALAPLGAHTGDYATLTEWANALNGHSLLDIYQVSGANYPPLTLALLDGSRWMHSLFSTGALTGPLWLVCLKLPAILADMGIGILVWRTTVRHGRSLWLLTATVFNPALIYLSAWWGQYESIYMLGALAAVLSASQGRFFWAGLWLGAGLMVKLQAAVVAPVIALVALQDANISRMVLNRYLKLAGGFALALLICLGPYVASGQFELVSARLVTIISGSSWLTVNALNMWYLLSLGKANWQFNAPVVTPDNTQLLPGLTLYTVGLILLALWTAATLWALVRNHRDSEIQSRDRAALWAGSLLYLGVFLWPTQIHERYAFGAVVMMGCGLACGDPPMTPRGRSYLLYGLITLLHALNLMWAAPFTQALDGWFGGNLMWGLGVALAMVATALWMLTSYWPRRTT